MTVPRGLVAGTMVTLGLAWGPYALSPQAWPGLTGAWVQTAIYLGNFVLTVCSRRAKRAVVRSLQRFLINPLVRTLFAAGLNPLGLAMLETRGRTSGRARRTPVGNGRSGSTLWVIAEHGLQAGYVRNILADPHVRVRLRLGLRYRWVDGLAEVLPDDDAVARQRRIIRWHPLRAVNALNVRTLGTDLLTVRIALRLPARRAVLGGRPLPPRTHRDVGRFELGDRAVQADPAESGVPVQRVRDVGRDLVQR